MLLPGKLAPTLTVKVNIKLVNAILRIATNAWSEIPIPVTSMKPPEELRWTAVNRRQPALKGRTAVNLPNSSRNDQMGISN
jgi:hypothetical protein